MLALHLLVLLLGITAAVIPLASTETAVAANHRRATQLRYDAEAALERVISELGDLASWEPVGAGLRTSTLRAPSSSIQVAGSATLDLNQITEELTLRGSGPDGVGRGLDWKLFAHGPIDTMMGASNAVAAPSHVSVWVASPRLGADADAAEALVLHALAIGPRGGRRAVQATVRRRTGQHVVAVVSWIVAQ